MKPPSKLTIFGPFIQIVCCISPFLMQTSYLFPILFEVSYQSKPHLRDSLVLRPPSMKTIFNFIMHAYLQKGPVECPKRQPCWWSDMGWGSPIASLTTWRQQPSLYPALGIMLVAHIKSLFCFYMTGELTEFSRESWTEEFKPRISLLNCSKTIIWVNWHHSCYKYKF